MAASFVALFTPSLSNALEHVRVWASGPLSPGVGAVPKMYFMAQAQGSAISPLSQINILTAWRARFGDPISGTRVFVKVEVVNSKGMKSATIVQTKIVP